MNMKMGNFKLPGTFPQTLLHQKYLSRYLQNTHVLLNNKLKL